MDRRAAGDIELVTVDASNWRAVADVAPRPDQTGFVTSVSRYLCLCNYDGDWQPLAITVDEQVVGFVMWAIDTDDSRWIGGLVVDGGQQGRGVGRAAVEALLAMFRDQPGATGAALAYAPDNGVARDLYASLGFVETGEMDDDEVVARLRF